jgi:glycosyltransferase involved in cell wall biosynthesis
MSPARRRIGGPVAHGYAGRPMVAVCVHDGFYGCGTGAGIANRAFIEALVGLVTADGGRSDGYDIDLVVLPVEISNSSPEYDGRWHARSLHLVDQVGGRVIPLDNGTRRTTRWGGLPAFEVLAEHAGEALIGLHSGLGPALIVAHDVPFYGLPATLPTDMVADLILVAHSTAGVHCPADVERANWERASLARAARRGGRVAAISDYMRHQLVGDYRLPPSAVIDLPIGLRAADWDRRPPADAELPDAARDGFWLAMGRAVPYKGFDDLLDALVILRASGTLPVHLVLAAVTDNGQLNDHQRHLAARIETEQLDVTLRTQFSEEISNLLAHPALQAVIVPSRAEPFGRIPIEAHAAGAAPVIATTAGGLADQVIDGHTGFTTPPGDPAGLAQALNRAASQPAAARDAMRAAAAGTAARYDTAATVAELLSSNGLR